MNTIFPKNRCRGFSLLEALVALVILSFGLLGIAGLQASSLKNNNNAYMRTQANILAYEAIDLMRANRDSALNGDYNIAVGATAGGSQLADGDLNGWKSRLANTLTSGDGSIACGANNVCVVTVQWGEVTPGVAQQSFVLSTEI